VAPTAYRRLGGWRVRLSNAEAANWGIMELLCAETYGTYMDEFV